MAIGARPANPGGVGVGVLYLGTAVGVLVVARSDPGFVLGASAAVVLAVAGVVAIAVGWVRRTVRWPQERDRRRRVTVYVMLAFTAPVLFLWTIDAAVSGIG